MTDNTKLDTGQQPVPYEDGDHCIFYAVQEASMYFSNLPLTVEDRSKYKQQTNRFQHLSEIVVQHDNPSLKWLTSSLRNIYPRLKSVGVSIEKIYCDTDTKQEIEDDNFFKRSNFLIESQEGEFEVDMKYPVLLYINRENDTHVWCCVSEEKFKNNYDKNIGPNDTVVLVATLKKD